MERLESKTIVWEGDVNVVLNKYKDKIPDIEDDFKKIITVIENSSPLENHTKEYYKNTVIIDEYMHSINNK